MSTLRVVPCLLVLLASASAPTHAQDLLLPEHPEAVAVPPLRPYVPPEPVVSELFGGARLLLIESRELPLVDGVMIFRGGRIEEHPEQLGLLDLLALALREGGSERTDGAALDAWLDSHAATLSVRAEFDSLRIEFSCVQSDLNQVLEFIGELIAIPAYPEAALQRSRARLLTQLARRDEDPSELARHLLDRIVYGADSVLARRPEKPTVERLTRADLLAHHRKMLGPNRLIVGVTGAVSIFELAPRLDSMLSGIRPVGRPAPTQSASFRQPARTRIYVYDKPHAPQAEIRLAGPGIRRIQRDYVPLFMWSYAIGAGGTANRLLVRLRTELGLIYQGGMFFAPEWTRAGRLLGSCSTKTEFVGRVVGTLIEILQEGRKPLSSEELKAVRRRVLNASVFEVDRPEKVLARALELEFYDYPRDFWIQRTERMHAMSAEEVAQSVARYVDTERLVFLVTGPAELLKAQLAPYGDVVLLESK